MKPIELLKKHCIFATDFDVYILFGIARKKDNEGITNSQEVVFREVIKSADNIEKKYYKLITKCNSYKYIAKKDLNFYIYVSVNARDVRKGYIAFKTTMIKYEREILFGVQCQNQLKRIDSIWLSAIMKPESRSKENRRFLIDIDTKDENLILNLEGQMLTNIINRVETKNGWHYITKPFDKRIFNFASKELGLKDICEVKSDALFFVEHIRGE